MTVTLRPLSGTDEINAGYRVFLRAMVGLPVHDVDATEIVDAGRYLGALDDGTVVAGVDSYGGWLTVPGGARTPHAAVTHVGVLPTHRRQGLANRLLSAQLRDIASRGEIVASLRASEAVIYERFGYGVATSAQSARVSISRASLRPGLTERGEIRLADDFPAATLRDIYDRVSWTGAIGRHDGWWRLHELFRESSRAAHYVVVHRTAGVDDGYAVYVPQDTEHWFSGREKTVKVTDFVALNDGARVGLWHHLLSLDLVDVVEFAALALDDPLSLAVIDRRAVALGQPRDETWLRLVDVEAALDARTFSGGDSVVVRVTDALIDTNNAVFEITPKAVVRTDARPDATVDVATLGAAYLGGTGWNHLAAAVPLGDPTPETIRRLDTLFGTPTLPFAGTSF